MKKKTELAKVYDKIRNTKKYKKWKQAVLKRDCQTYPVIPKGTQVHHLKPFREILKHHNIKTVEASIKCKELWDTTNGVAIRKGEHYILFVMSRSKSSSKGFIQLLKRFSKEQSIADI